MEETTIFLTAPNTVWRCFCILEEGDMMGSDASELGSSSWTLAGMVGEHKVKDTQKAMPGVEGRFIKAGCSWSCTEFVFGSADWKL